VETRTLASLLSTLDFLGLVVDARLTRVCLVSAAFPSCVAPQGQRDFTVSTMHGDMTGIERELNLKEFRSGSSRVLIVTDQFACTLEVQVSLVINFDMRQWTLHTTGAAATKATRGN
jgi:hypothetical protein